MRGNPYYGRSYQFFKFKPQDLPRPEICGTIDPDFDDLDGARIEVVDEVKRKIETDC